MRSLEENPWKITSKKDVYETPWITVTHHDVVNPAGNQGIYGTVHFKNYALGIVALDENNDTWIVGQYRFPMNEYTWEIPEGGGPVGEDPLISAKRELMEETGIEASDWLLIQHMQLSNSASDEVAFLYLAKNLIYHKPHPEENEELQQRKIHFETLYAMVKAGKVTDSLTVAAVLKIKLMMLEGEL
ncbi:MAG: NUDIX hydrolase [Bacteroidota bacterium]